MQGLGMLEMALRETNSAFQPQQEAPPLTSPVGYIVWPNRASLVVVLANCLLLFHLSCNKRVPSVSLVRQTELAWS